MANKRHKPQEIVTKLRQVEVLIGQGRLSARLKMASDGRIVFGPQLCIQIYRHAVERWRQVDALSAAAGEREEKGRGR